MEAPSPDDVRQALTVLDARRQKIVAGLFAVMIQNPAQVRDREWISQQLAEISLLAGEFEADNPGQGVDAVQAYLAEHAEQLLKAGFLLFQRVGLDLAPRAGEGFTFEDALQAGLEYLPS